MILKSIISPFQKVLLSRRLCVGCTFPLDKAPRILQLSDTKFMLQCKCKRRYVLDKALNAYRRATFDEERLFIESKKQ